MVDYEVLSSSNCGCAGSQVGEVRLGLVIRSCTSAVEHVGAEAGPSGTSIVRGREDPLCMSMAGSV